MSPTESLTRFFRSQAPVDPGDRILVAFSGGPDSTALLWGLHQVGPRLGVEIHAAHLDHGLDKHSRHRAQAAASTAQGLGIPFQVERRHPFETRSGNEPSSGLEAEARRERYAFLEEHRQAIGARYVATAHHLDDQAETVLLRLLFGSGLEGLAGIQPILGAVVRPFLHLLSEELRASLVGSGLSYEIDPTNRDRARPRNRIRHGLLPHLARDTPDLHRRLARLADSVHAFRSSLDRRFNRSLAPRLRESRAGVDRRALESLPVELRASAIRFVQRAAGAPYPPSRGALSELFRQLESNGEVGCDCGGGWRWFGRGDRLVVCHTRPKTADFTYTLQVPGALQLEELALRVSVRRSKVLPWMFRSSPRRAALALPLEPGDSVTIRSRRPGDRIQPFGWSQHCRVKELLINRRVPLEQRSRLPLLCCDGIIAWIPGVAINERFRLPARVSSGKEVWVAEVEQA